ncbi:amidohydrolase family protein [Amycolatopsis pithecellobii]|uniref:Amidohydrolase family protein n=1 Tax=Amycolatopsis pithecellobii TaxID=664692 RepID=A0A6N7YX13_9PSEU|nr:amidohydrolase family protein [Amycolatopsis pithecellobii]MTD52879.1 amidohydrolase family protein [Amycolatopsis pithecellobii]
MTIPDPSAQVPSDDRILIRGGCVLSMDSSVGDFPNADILVENGVITEIAPSIHADARVVDAGDTIIFPGFCDPHIHSWEGALARLIPHNTTTTEEDSGLAYADERSHLTRSYFNVLHHRFAPLYEPEDTYIGTLFTMLTAINGGITTVCDNMHNTRNIDHSIASIQALADSGIRGVHAYGRPRVGDYDRNFLANARKLRADYFSSDDQLTTMRMYALGRDTLDEIREILAVRRELDLWVTFDSGLETQPLAELYSSGEFDGRETLNHACFLSADQRKLMRDGGTRVNVCPRIETQFRRGYVPYPEWTELGVHPGLSNDNPATYAVDMFAEMHTLYNQCRAQRHREGVTPEITLRETLAAATIRGADNCGLGDVTGSLSPGKAADLVIVDTNSPLLSPINNAYATVVQAAHAGAIRDVMIGGRFVKWQGSLNLDFPALKDRVLASQSRLLERAGWPLDAIDFTD